MAAMGVDVSDTAAVAKARRFLRAGGFAEGGIEGDDAMRMAAMGVDVSDAAAVAKARRFLRAGGYADTADTPDTRHPSTLLPANQPFQEAAAARRMLQRLLRASGDAPEGGMFSLDDTHKEMHQPPDMEPLDPTAAPRYAHGVCNVHVLV
jgi:hypothetical protein